MLKRIIFVCFIFSFCSTLCSCETIRGTANGLSQDVKNTCDNIFELGSKIKQANQRLEEDLW